MLKGICVCAAMVAAASLQPAVAQSLGGCSMFPANNVWNTPVDESTGDPNSAAYGVRSGRPAIRHPDFDSTGEEFRTWW